MAARTITFLSDYGLGDEFVGVVHGVIAGICPQARVIDLGHGVPRQDVQAGALTLERALPYMPAGVHLAVVDPEVGARRRAVALRTAEEDRLLVGPDNGLLIPAAERFGGVLEAIEISTSPWRLEPVSATFHGRDVFAPVAARLGAGAELLEAGDPLDLAELHVLHLPTATVEDGAATGHAVLVDRYGNVALDMDHDVLLALGLTIGAPVRVIAGGQERDARVVQTFADVPAGELILYEDSWGSLALAINRGDAAAALGLGPDDKVRVAPLA
jgi:S-adenosyl-L-methionine hydrolase (adenosine-forming)